MTHAVRRIAAAVVVVCAALATAPSADATAIYHWSVPLTPNPTCLIQTTKVLGESTTCFEAQPTGILVVWWNYTKPNLGKPMVATALINYTNPKWGNRGQEQWLFDAPQAPSYSRFLPLPGPAEYGQFPGPKMFLAVTPITDFVKTTGMKAAHKGVKYRFVLTAGGGKGPFTWRLLKPLPGLVLSKTGVLTGTPTRLGSFVVDAQVTNGWGVQASNLPMTLQVK